MITLHRYAPQAEIGKRRIDLKLHVSWGSEPILSYGDQLSVEVVTCSARKCAYTRRRDATLLLLKVET